jgi:hypothetical protein
MWNPSSKFIQETLDLFVLKTKVEFKNINFAFVYLNDPFGNNLGLKKCKTFKKKILKFSCFLKNVK